MTFWFPKYIWAEETKPSKGGDIWEIKGKSHWSGHEKGHEFLNYRSSRHPDRQARTHTHTHIHTHTHTHTHNKPNCFVNKWCVCPTKISRMLANCRTVRRVSSYIQMVAVLMIVSISSMCGMPGPLCNFALSLLLWNCSTQRYTVAPDKALSPYIALNNK